MRVTVRLPPDILAAVKKEAAKKEIPPATLIKLLVAQHIWRKKSRKDKQHWLESIYAGKAKRKVKSFEDLFSD